MDERIKAKIEEIKTVAMECGEHREKVLRHAVYVTGKRYVWLFLKYKFCFRRTKKKQLRAQLMTLQCVLKELTNELMKE